jgi:pimeloyl-ACP methyl ester carboxylesterase
MSAIFQHSDDTGRLAAFDRPVLLVKGEGTARYNLMIVDALKRHLPRSRVVELPGGHMAPVTALQEVLTVMEAFQLDER